MKIPKTISLSLAIPLLLLFLQLPTPATALSYSVSATRDGVPIPDHELRGMLQETPSIPRSGPNSGSGNVSPSKTARSQNGKRNTNLVTANWAGAFILAADPKTAPVTTAQGFIQVPLPTFRPGAKDPTAPQTVSEWIGIDGVTNDAMLYAGSTQEVTSDGNITYSWWWEWYPDTRVTLSGVVNYYDWIQVIVSASDPNTASIFLWDLANAIRYNFAITDGPTLSRSSWDYVTSADNGDLFPTWQSSGIYFQICSGSSCIIEPNLDNATTMEIEIYGNVLATTNVKNSFTFFVYS